MLSPLDLSSRHSFDGEVEMAISVFDRVEPILASGVFLSPSMISTRTLEELTRKRKTVNMSADRGSASSGTDAFTVSSGHSTYLVARSEDSEGGGASETIRGWDTSGVDIPKRLAAREMAQIVKYFVSGAYMMVEVVDGCHYDAEAVLTDLFKYFSDHPGRELNALYSNIILYFLSIRYFSILDILREKRGTLVLALILMEFWECYNLYYDDKSRRRREQYASTEDPYVVYAKKPPLIFKNPSFPSPGSRPAPVMQFFTFSSEAVPPHRSRGRYWHDMDTSL